jgi:hypothetical protein
MAIFEVQGPDGKTYEVDAPTAQQAAGAFSPASQAAPSGASSAPTGGFLNNALNTLTRVGSGMPAVATAETAAHLASGGVAGLVGGLGYLGALGNSGLSNLLQGKLSVDTDAAKQAQEGWQNALTYQPRTAAGKKLAGAIDSAMSVIPKAANATGEFVADNSGSPALGAAINTGLQSLPMLLGLKEGRVAAAADAANAADQAASVPKATPTTPAEQLAQSLDNGKAVGYQTTPEIDPSSSFLDRLGMGIAGKAQLRQGATVGNQAVTNALASRSIGLPPASLITQQALQQVRQAAIDKGYAPIAELDGPITADAQFMRNNADIKAAHGDSLAGNPDVTETANILMGLKKGTSSDLDPMTLQQRSSLPAFDPASVTDQISTLRSRAQDAYAAGRPSAGQAFRQQAGELEALVDRHLQDLDDASPDLLTNYRAARQLIAKTHTIQDAINPSTGNVDASAIGTKLRNGVPLDGDLKTIADFANSAPSISGIPTGAPLPTSPINTAAGVATAHATGGASLALIPAARSLAAHWLLRHADNPAALQPVGKSLGQSAIDAVHGNSKAFAALYGGVAPGVLASDPPDPSTALRGSPLSASESLAALGGL